MTFIRTLSTCRQKCDALARTLLLAVIGISIAPCAVYAEELLLELSTQSIAITSTYNGDDIVIFGVIDRDASSFTRAGAQDVVITIKGPLSTITLREKKPFGPVYINQKEQIFTNVPRFFALLSTRPLLDAASELARERLKLVYSDYLTPPATPAEKPTGRPSRHAVQQPSIGQSQAAREKTNATDLLQFQDAATRLQKNAGLLIIDDKNIRMVRPNLFKASIVLPSNAPTGSYTVEASLLQEGLPLVTSSARFVVYKTGYEALLARAARRRSFLYGLSALLMVLLFGWSAYIIFKRE